MIVKSFHWPFFQVVNILGTYLLTGFVEKLAFGSIPCNISLLQPPSQHLVVLSLTQD